MRNDIVRYVNSQGDEQFLNKGNCRCNTKALREFLYTVQNRRLYSNQPKTIIIELLFNGAPEDRDQIIDNLEYDTAKGTKGKLYVNDWYILCRFVGIQTISKEGENNIRMDLQFNADTIEWNYEYTFETAVEETEIAGTADYPTNYPFNYSIRTTLDNSELTPADFILETKLTSEMVTAKEVEYTITGEDGTTQTYTVNLDGYTIAENDKFILNTQEKTVVIIHAGETVSVFGGASDTSYIFEQLAAGESRITSSYDSTVKFTMIQHRRAPKWRT